MPFAAGITDVDVDGKYGFLYTTSCNTFKYTFDDDENYECLAEEYLFDGDGGGVAYMGNTNVGSTFSSNEIARKFFNYLTAKTSDPDDDVYLTGLAHILARWDYMPNNLPSLYAYTCNLGGDPITTAYTAEPGTLAMTYDTSSNGAYIVDVTVTDANENAVANAEVTLWVPETYYLPALKTNENGHVRFKTPGSFSGGMLTAFKHNYIPDLIDNVSTGD
jgi:hypothetical protein